MGFSFKKIAGPVLAATLPGVGQGIIAGASSILDYKGAKDANAANAKMVEDQIATQRDMANLAWSREMEASNTAYQRATADMRKAGINPMLAYMQGGASTPSAAGAQGASTQMHNVFEGASASARDSLRIRNEARTVAQNLKESDSRIDANEASRDAHRAAARKSNVEADIADAELPFVRDKAEYDRDNIVLDAWLRRLGLIGGTARDAAIAGYGVKRGIRTPKPGPWIERSGGDRFQRTFK